MPFCAADLHFLADSAQIRAILGSSHDQAMPGDIFQPDVPSPPSVWGLCCSRLGGPHDCPPLEDRRMEWSPRHPSTSGADSHWIGQWLCRSRSRCIRVADLPTFPSAWCHGCQHVAGSLLGVVSGEINSVCANMTPSGVHPNSGTRPANCPKCACP